MKLPVGIPDKAAEEGWNAIVRCEFRVNCVE
jgi:hypothetical protein